MMKPLSILPPQTLEAATLLRASLAPVKRALAFLPANDDAEKEGGNAAAMHCAIARFMI